MEFLPGTVEAIRLLNAAGFRVILVTNQRCVAKGLITVADLDSIHMQMCDTLGHAGATIDSIYICPHEKHPPCSCRKPAPGMLYEAARAHSIDLPTSWMIGDSEVDVEAGRNAGCNTAQVIINSETEICKADVVAPSLLEAVHQILQRDKIAVSHGVMDLVQSNRKEGVTEEKHLRLVSEWQSCFRLFLQEE